MRRRTGRGALSKGKPQNPSIFIIQGAPNPSDETQLFINWSTNLKSTSQVEYGLTAAYGSFTTLNPTLTTNHAVTITGLTSFTLYHFRVISTTPSGGTVTSADQTATTGRFQIVTANLVAGSVIPVAQRAVFSATTVAASNFATPTQSIFYMTCAPAAAIPDPFFCYFYMAFTSPQGSGVSGGTDYYGWYNLDGLYPDPGDPFGGIATGIQIIVNSSDDGTAVANATQTALGGYGITVTTDGAETCYIYLDYGNNSGDQIYNLGTPNNIDRYAYGTDPSWFEFWSPYDGGVGVIPIVDGVGSGQFFQGIAQQGSTTQIQLACASTDTAAQVASSLVSALTGAGYTVTSFVGTTVQWRAITPGGDAFNVDGTTPTFFTLSVPSDGTYDPQFIFYDNAAGIGGYVQISLYLNTGSNVPGSGGSVVISVSYAVTDTAAQVAAKIAANASVTFWSPVVVGAALSLKNRKIGATASPMDGPGSPIGHGFTISTTTTGKP